MKENLERQLDELFAASRRAFSDFEPSADFLAQVWRRIEERRQPSWLQVVLSWSPKLAAAAAIAAVVLGLSTYVEEQRKVSEELLDRTYVDALTVDSLDEDDSAMWTLAGNR